MKPLKLFWILLIAGPARCAAASDLQVTVSSSGVNLYAVALETRVQAEQQALWNVLTDYDHHAKVLPYLSKSRLVLQEKNFKVVDQEGRIRILFWTFTMRVKQKVFEEPPSHMRFEAVDGDFKRLEGDWNLSPDETASVGTRLQCRFLVEPKRRVPEWAVRFAVRRYLAKMVSALQEKAESQ